MFEYKYHYNPKIWIGIILVINLQVEKKSAICLSSRQSKSQILNSKKKKTTSSTLVHHIFMQ